MQKELDIYTVTEGAVLSNAVEEKLQSAAPTIHKHWTEAACVT